MSSENIEKYEFKFLLNAISNCAFSFLRLVTVRYAVRNVYTGTEYTILKTLKVSICSMNVLIIPYINALHRGACLNILFVCF
jgi:hypothetical protein